MTKNGTTKSPTTEAPKASKSTKPTKGVAAVKAAKGQKETTDAKRPQEPADRLPTNLEELKATKARLVSFLFLSGKGKKEIATDLKAAFNLTDVQAIKIVRRITGRARFYQRVFQLMATK